MRHAGQRHVVRLVLLLAHVFDDLVALVADHHVDEGGGVPVKIRVADMKAMFWVKDYLGNRDFVARRDFDPAKRVQGRRAVLTFHDDETIWGMVTEDEAGLPGFFFVPADEADNNIRIFVIRASVKELRWAP